jgi:RHS repeat-associated protein
MKFHHAVTAAMLLLVQVQADVPPSAPARIVANRTLPKMEVFTPFVLPEHPQPEDFKRLREFAEPLIPVGAELTPEDTAAFAVAVKSVLKAMPTVEFGPLEAFLAAHTKSPWRAAIQVNLAIGYYGSGWYSKSLAASEEAWTLAKSSEDPDVHRLADRALAEWLKLNSRLGRQDVLERTFAEIQDRKVSANVGTWVNSAYEAMFAMQTQPGFCFRCGPMALKEILRAQKAPGDWEAFLLATKSPRTGFSLKEVHEMSEKLGMKMQIARRAPGAEVLLPAVVHWKVGHYAALQRRLETGLILSQDLTFAQTAALSEAALDHEASGVFLVPAGALPNGWTLVDPNAASQVFGKGFTDARGKDDPGCPTPSTAPACESDCGSDGNGNGNQSQGMPTYSVNLMQVALTVKDTPVGYSPPVGPPINLTLRYHEEMTPLNEIRQETMPFASSQISHNWYSYILSFPLIPDLDVRLLTRGASWRTFRNFNATTSSFDPEFNSGDILRRVSSTPRVYELTHSDGSVEIFSVPGTSIYGSTADNLYLSSIRDPHGNTVTLHYDSVPRLIGISDAIGQVTIFAYPPTPQFGAPISKISTVTDPFGRFASFGYLLPLSPVSRITDTLGLSSDLEWGDSKPVSSSGSPGGPSHPPIRILTALVTPYGRTTFQRTISGLTRRMTVTDPQGDAEVVEYRDDAPGVPGTSPNPFGGVTGWMQYRNSFHWTKEMWAHHPEDYTKATNYHWQHGNPSSMTGNALESVKKPLENRVWFTNAGQSGLAHQGTFHSPSSIARIMDDGSVQRTFTDHNARGNVVREVDAAGRETTYVYAANGIDLLETRRTDGSMADGYARLSSATYTAQHLPLTTTDMAGQTTSYTWNARGQLITVTDPIGAVTTLGYHADGYLTSVNGPLPGAQDTISLTYDAYGRPATWTDVDGYMLAYQYDAMDRMTRTSYMDGTYEEYTYNRLDRATARDRQGRITTWSYNALRQLIATTDPANRTLRYEWCRCGDLRVLFDAMGRATQWKRDIQGRVTAKVYADGSQYRYDYEKASSRLKRRTDAKGQFTDYQWTADDQIARISYPNAEIATPTRTYTYDPVFNRMTSAIAGPEPYYYSYHPITNGPAPGAGRPAKREGRYSDEAITYNYDTRGLLSRRAIAGQEETWTYDLDGRVLSNGTPAGPLVHTYDGGTDRLSSRLMPNGILTVYSYSGPTGDHRLEQIKHSGPAGLIAQFDYTYLPEGAVLSWRQQLGNSAGVLQTFSYDGADQLTSVTSLHSAGEVTTTYTYDLAGNRLKAVRGNSIGVSNYSNVNSLQSTPDTTSSAVYDWDGANRMNSYSNDLSGRTKITYSPHETPISKIAADGSVNRMIYDNADGVATHQEGGAVCLRFADGRVFVRNGEMIYTCEDHLGSSRYFVNNQDLEKFVNFDEFGAFQQAQQEDCEFISGGFTNYTKIKGFNLLMAPHRFYDPGLGRFLSQDPLGEAGGVNLFLYTNNAPVFRTDYLGLDWNHWVNNASSWLVTSGAYTYSLGAANALYFNLPGYLIKNFGVTMGGGECDPLYKAGYQAGNLFSYIQGTYGIKKAGALIAITKVGRNRQFYFRQGTGQRPGMIAKKTIARMWINFAKQGHKTQSSANQFLSPNGNE